MQEDFLDSNKKCSYGRRWSKIKIYKLKTETKYPKIRDRRGTRVHEYKDKVNTLF